MPFALEYREVYDQVYKPVCLDNGFECWRVDEKNAPGSITRDIVNGILDADLVVADLTSRNPNVFYELGIAHSAGNKTIMTAQNPKEIPFDIANYRVLMYEQSIAGAKRLYAGLDSAIKELLKSLEQTNNPVQEVLAMRGPVKLARKRLLLEAINVSWLQKRTREIVAAEPLVYLDDLRKLDLEAIKQKYDLRPGILSEIATMQFALGLVVDEPRFHSIVMKYKLVVDTDARLVRYGFRNQAAISG